MTSGRASSETSRQRSLRPASGWLAGAIRHAVAGFAAGDAVMAMTDFFGTRNGSYAQYQPVPAGLAAPKPRGLSHAEAAAIPLAAGTAFEACCECDRSPESGPGRAIAGQRQPARFDRAAAVFCRLMVFSGDK